VIADSQKLASTLTFMALRNASVLRSVMRGVRSKVPTVTLLTLAHDLDSKFTYLTSRHGGRMAVVLPARVEQRLGHRLGT
jgi:hypothetical protein